jgi:hypothetical protein
MADDRRRRGWSEGRADEFAERTEASLREVRGEVRDLREKIDRRSDIALGVMTASLVGLIVSHFVG